MSTTTTTTTPAPEDTVRIVVLPEFSMYMVEGRTQSYRMKMTVTEAENTVEVGPKAIFLRRRADLGQEVVDEFISVCSPWQMEHYPLDEPYEGDYYYRVDAIDLLFLSAGQRQEVFEDIQNDIDELVRSIKGLNDLEPQTPIVFEH